MRASEVVTPDVIDSLRNEGFLIIQKPITKIDKNPDDGTTRVTIKSQVDGQEVEGFAMVSDQQARTAQTDALTHSGRMATTHYLHSLATVLGLIK